MGGGRTPGEHPVDCKARKVYTGTMDNTIYIYNVPDIFLQEDGPGAGMDAVAFFLSRTPHKVEVIDTYLHLGGGCTYVRYHIIERKEIGNDGGHGKKTARTKRKK